MQHNSVNSDLRFLGSCLLGFTAIYVLISNNWGYAYFMHFLENLVVLGVLPQNHIAGTPIGDSISFNISFATIVNSIIIALFTAFLVVSSYNIVSKMKVIGRKVSFLLYTAFICAIVFLISTYSILHAAIVISNHLSNMEPLLLFELGHINTGGPFLNNIQPNASSLWLSVIPYIILNFVRVMTAGFLALRMHRKLSLPKNSFA